MFKQSFLISLVLTSAQAIAISSQSSSTKNWSEVSSAKEIVVPKAVDNSLKAPQNQPENAPAASTTSYIPGYSANQPSKATDGANSPSTPKSRREDILLKAEAATMGGRATPRPQPLYGEERSVSTQEFRRTRDVLTGLSNRKRG